MTNIQDDRTFTQITLALILSGSIVLQMRDFMYYLFDLSFGYWWRGSPLPFELCMIAWSVVNYIIAVAITSTLMITVSWGRDQQEAPPPGHR